MSWLKQNAYVVAAISLPLVLAMLFIAAREVPHWLVDDPAYDILVAIEEYSQPNRPYSTQFVVDQGDLYARVGYSPQAVNYPELRLYRYSPITEDWSEIDFEAPQQIVQDLSARVGGGYVEERVHVPLAFKVTNRAKAPDGYEFSAHWRRNENVFGFFFGMSRNRHINVMHKDGRMINVKAPPSMNLYAGQIRFVGWVVTEEDQ